MRDFLHWSNKQPLSAAIVLCFGILRLIANHLAPCLEALMHSSLISVQEDRQPAYDVDARGSRRRGECVQYSGYYYH